MRSKSFSIVLKCVAPLCVARLEPRPYGDEMNVQALIAGS